VQARHDWVNQKRRVKAEPLCLAAFSGLVKLHLHPDFAAFAPIDQPFTDLKGPLEIT
jgi:hypothetical protein